MKKFFSWCALIVLPVLAMVALALVVRLTMPAPKGVTSIVETGEVWYNPTSWALNESAEHATMQANKAMTASVGYTQGMTLAASAAAGIGLTLLVLSIRKGWVFDANVNYIPESAAATSTPKQVAPKVAAGPKVPKKGKSTLQAIPKRQVVKGDKRDPALMGVARQVASA